MKKNVLTVLMLSSGLILTACNDSNNDTERPPSANIDVNHIQNPVVGTPAAYSLTDMSAVAADSVVMTYKMKGISGTEVLATSLVFTPKTAAPAGGWPIVAWAHGTTGVADVCAPSRNVINPAVQSMIAKFLALGYVVVAPDYEGLGEPGDKELHPFLNLKSEGYSITDAVVATRNWLGNKASSKWVTVGHSQGGQAALGAAQYAARANLDYKGTVAVAPASHLGLILSAGELSVASAPPAAQIPVYASLDTFTALITAGLKNTNPNLTYSQIFKSPTDQIAQHAESVCFDTLGKQFGVAMGQYAAMNGTLNGYPRTTDGFMSLPLVKTFLDIDSQPLKVQIKTPITIYQGGADTTVPIIATNALNATAQAFGTQVNYITNPSWDHSTAYALNIDNIVADAKGMLSAR
ncbi:alpha/beta hydrolase family protein [Acinetobacter sp. ANC 4648]|uniref:alpha/beta hydrolase family protein n=1 Tax=Acinetobacter sp. ANC 4648 TaxID=1977875 RepID=UPI000A335632|nr:alpha/beta fold hydrolase [Acinetobacter sp. ANC 4648]OTG83623.1 triacylglycerol lipase [Acinetobacter sp. ANC 4648]